MPSEQVKLVAIRVDGDTQTRAGIDEVAVRDYASDIKRGDIFPEVIVFYDSLTYWMADGFHRYEAHRLLKKRMIAADVREGGQRDALLFGLGANVGHGIRRSNADKRHAVKTMLSDPDWRKWSDNEIAKHCCVSGPMVLKWRQKLHDQPDQRRKFTRGGKTQEVSISSGPPKSEKKEPIRDALGNAILSDELAAVFQEKARLKGLFSRLGEIGEELKLVSTKPIGIYLDQQRIMADIKNLRNALKFAQPHAICPSCEGDRCEECRQSGFITKEIYNRLPDTVQKY